MEKGYLFDKWKKNRSNEDNMLKYLILGHGYIGTWLVKELDDCVVTTRRVVNISDAVDEITKYEPDVVINAIGKTGKPNVDWCEDNKEDTFFGNVSVPLFIAEACAKCDVYMVHLSSGCIYESEYGYDEKLLHDEPHIPHENIEKYHKSYKLVSEPFTEEDEPNFIGSFYSRTKLYAEKCLDTLNRNGFCKILQLRLRIPFDPIPSPRNLITKLVSYRRVISIPNSMTYIPDFLKIAGELIDKRKIGIYNIMNAGFITHPEILDMYIELIDPDFEYEIISLEELDKMVKAKRSNCVHSVNKLELEGIKVRDVKDATKDCLYQYKKKIGER